MLIKQATAADAQEILALQKLAYQSEAELYNDFNIPPLAETLEEIKNEFNRQIFLKAVLNDKIIGSVRGYLKDGICYIGRFIVHPDCQSRGIGTKLMQEIERVLGAASEFQLFTGHKSERNIHLYLKLGYKKYKTEKVLANLELVYLKKLTVKNGERL